MLVSQTRKGVLYDRITKDTMAPAKVEGVMLDRIIALYDAWAKPELATEWQTKLATEQEAVASGQPGQGSSDEKKDE